MGEQELARPVGEMTGGEFKELVKEEMAEAERRIAEARVAYAADVEQQCRDLPAEDRSVGDMTVGELRALIREVLEEERRKDYYIDEEGSLVFFSEETYADYFGFKAGTAINIIKEERSHTNGYRMATERRGDQGSFPLGGGALWHRAPLRGV